MENKMEQVAQLLGVTIGEEFTIRMQNGKPTNDLYRLTNSGLKVFIDSDWTESPGVLAILLRGIAEIIKLPWIPKNGSKYFFVSFDGTVCETIYSENIYFDQVSRSIGNCYHTAEGARAQVKRWEAFFARTDPLDVLAISEQEGAK